MPKTVKATPAQRSEFAFTPSAEACLPPSLKRLAANCKDSAVFLRLIDGSGFWFLPRNSDAASVSGFALYGGRWVPRTVPFRRVERYY